MDKNRIVQTTSLITWISFPWSINEQKRRAEKQEKLTGKDISSLMEHNFSQTDVR
jgi:hypothetical protein